LIKCGISLSDVLTCIKMMGRSKDFSPFDMQLMKDVHR